MMMTLLPGLQAPLGRLASTLGLQAKSSPEPAGQALDPHSASENPSLADPYTGLYNRRGLALKGDALLARLKREGLPACVVELDCSELRTVRDVCGRAAAQKLLCHVATRVVRLVGARGLAARSESTQFTLVLPGTRDDVAQAVAAEFGDPPRITGEKVGGLRMLNMGRVSIKEVHGALHAAPAACESASQEEACLRTATIYLDSTSAMPVNCAATQPLNAAELARAIQAHAARA
jgi:diguanylate cyclase (GGDEF)-like protein